MQILDTTFSHFVRKLHEKHEGRITQLVFLYRCKLALSIFWSCLYPSLHKISVSPLLKHGKFIKSVSAVDADHVYVCVEMLWLCTAICGQLYALFPASRQNRASCCHGDLIRVAWELTSHSY